MVDLGSVFKNEFQLCMPKQKVPNMHTHIHLMKKKKKYEKLKQIMYDETLVLVTTEI